MRLRARGIFVACGLAAAVATAGPAAAGPTNLSPLPATVAAGGATVRSEVGSFCVTSEPRGGRPGIGLCADAIPRKPGRAHTLAVAPRSKLSLTFRERPRLQDTVARAGGTLLRFRGRGRPVRAVASVAVERNGEGWSLRLPKRLHRANALMIQVAFDGGGDAIHLVGLRGKRRQPLRCPGRIGVPVKAAPIRGLSVADARAESQRRGCELRVVRIDGRDLAITADLSDSRVNVFVRDGRITRVDGIY